MILFLMIMITVQIQLCSCSGPSSGNELVPGDEDTESDGSLEEEKEADRISPSDGDVGESELESDSGSEPVDPPLPVRLLELRATSARNIRIIWEPVARSSRVFIERAEGSNNRYIKVGEKKGSHGRFLDLGLAPLGAYHYRLTACNVIGCSEPTFSLPVETPPTLIPDSILTVDTGEFLDDVVLFQVLFDTIDIVNEGYMIAVDRRGKVLWEYATRIYGSVTEIQVLPDHSLATCSESHFKQFDLDGELIFDYQGNTAHHDIDLLADGRLMFLFFDQIETSDPEYTILGDGILILNQDWNAAEWSWYGRDHIPLSDVNEFDIQANLFNLGYDWTHANALWFDEENSKIYMNVRNLNRIYKIDYPSGAVDWIMGDGGDFGEGLWSHSHDPVYLPNNHVLLFDNGLLRQGGEQFSRIIEVAYDPEAKTAEIVWEYRETPDFFSYAFGSVKQQGDGHIFLTDGLNGRLLEVDREKKKVWEMQIPIGTYIYKADTLPLEFFTEW